MERALSFPLCFFRLISSRKWITSKWREGNHGTSLSLLDWECPFFYGTLAYDGWLYFISHFHQFWDMQIYNYPSEYPRNDIYFNKTKNDDGKDIFCRCFWWRIQTITAVIRAAIIISWIESWIMSPSLDWILFHLPNKIVLIGRTLICDRWIPDSIINIAPRQLFPQIHINFIKVPSTEEESRIFSQTKWMSDKGSERIPLWKRTYSTTKVN